MLSTRIYNELTTNNYCDPFWAPIPYILYINDIHMALHSLNSNCNLILLVDDTSVSISEPSNKTL